MYAEFCFQQQHTQRFLLQPSSCTLAYLLSEAHRGETADLVNRAILGQSACAHSLLFLYQYVRFSFAHQRLWGSPRNPPWKRCVGSSVQLMRKARCCLPRLTATAKLVIWCSTARASARGMSVPVELGDLLGSNSFGALSRLNASRLSGLLRKCAVPPVAPLANSPPTVYSAHPEEKSGQFLLALQDTANTVATFARTERPSLSVEAILARAASDDSIRGSPPPPPAPPSSGAGGGSGQSPAGSVAASIVRLVFSA